VTVRAATRRWSVAVLAGLLLLAGCERKKEAAAPPPPPSLKVATAAQKSVPLYGEFVGTLVGVKAVDIRARVEGFLAKREFTDGADVKEGQLLFVIDQKPFLAALAQAVAQLARDEANHAQARAQLAQALANLSKAEAQLAGDEANLSYAREQVERYRPLAAREFVTTEAFHQTETLARGAAATVESDKAAIKAAAAAVDASRAAVDQAAATIQADRAAITQAELNLSYTTMYAPMAGRIGRRQVDVGNLVGAGQSTLLASIVQLDPIYVYFSVPERDARTLLTQRAGNLPVTVTMAGQAPHAQPGRVDFVNNSVDPTTGTFQVRATVANREGVLLPGQYAQVRLLMGTRPDAVLVPEQAILEEQGGQSVLVVGPDRKVQRRKVTAGSAFEGQRIIESGLKAGEDVLVEGLQKVRPGMVVDPKR
jgi:membrane fusion protein, multidrug efflux system